MGFRSDSAGIPGGREPDLESRSFYRALLDSDGPAMFIARIADDGTFVCESANAGLADIANCRLDEMIGKAPSDYLPGEVAANLEAMLRLCAESGKQVTYSMAYDGPDGRTAWTTNLVPVKENSGTIRHIIGLVRDITFEKHRQVTADRNEALLGQVGLALPQIYYLFNLKTRCVHHIAGQNSKPQGYEAEEFFQLGDEVMPRLIHPADMAGAETNLASLAHLRDGESSIFQYRIRHSDGSYRNMLDRQSVFSRADDGSVELIFGIAEDVTGQDRMREELRGLSDRLLTLQIDERRRIARDLHDSTGQHLTAAALALARIGERLAKDKARIVGSSLVDAKMSIDEAKKEIRVLSYLLHPPGVTGAGLGSAIRSFAAGFGSRAGLGIETRIEPQQDEVADEVAVAFFRVLQEGLANVHRHSKATQVVVALEIGRSEVTLLVTDNGVGFEDGGLEPCDQTGVGLRAMRERMIRLGGSLRLYRDELGTNLIASAPRFRT